MNSKIEFLGSIIIRELSDKFEPQCFEGKVKYRLDANFKKYVLNSAKTINHLPEMKFSKYHFTESIYDDEIMESFSISKSSGLMFREEILWTIANLIKQSKGEVGFLINNGCATIVGYILCSDGLVRAVTVSRSVGISGWDLGCYDLGHWPAGREMLSRN